MRFRSDPSSLRGSIAPVVTPFTETGGLDLDGLRRLITWQLDSGSPPRLPTWAPTPRW
jgi:4-hydroxy-tetrahydrodipicolinate synthase